MITPLATFASFLGAFSSVSSHPDQYSSSLKDTVDCSNYPTIMSWHVHVTYMLTNDDQIKRATALREEALKDFADLLGEDPGRFAINNMHL